MDYDYRVSVSGLHNAIWLLNELSRSFVFKSAMPLAHDRELSLCSFQAPFTALLPFAVFKRILAAMPRVELVMQPALA
jgi:hypothetical protein